MRIGSLFSGVGEVHSKSEANSILSQNHYLGATSRGKAYVDPFGTIVVANPSSRHLPQSSWQEIIRWCITVRTQNAGTMQWAAFISWFRVTHPHVTTIVSYSDPSVGHDGALYRASGWLWAPTWQRIRPPPTGQGSWDGIKKQAAKDRWVFLVAEDESRERILRVNDESIARRLPWVSYREPTWKNGRPVLVRQHERYVRWMDLTR